jgi:hypothetical protein
MSDSRCCGTCDWWKEWMSSNLGECMCPFPYWIGIAFTALVAASAGADCPCWKRREVKEEHG